MAAPAKFLFDNDFGRSSRAGAGAMLSPQQQAAVAEAEARGFRNGAAAAKAEAATEAERRVASALTRAAAALASIAQGFDQLEMRLEAEAVGVAMAVASKLAPALIAREPMAEVEELAAECFRQLVSAPHVVVRVHDAVFDAARPKLEAIAATCGMQGRLVVLAEPDIGPGDCRVEWADGGAVRDRAAVEVVIASAVERYLSVRRPAADSSSGSQTQ